MRYGIALLVFSFVLQLISFCIEQLTWYSSFKEWVKFRTAIEEPDNGFGQLVMFPSLISFCLGLFFVILNIVSQFI